MDSPEPEWKYLSGFAIKKGAADKGAKGTLTNLLTPRRGVNDVVRDAAPPAVIDDSPLNQPGNEPSLEPFNETQTTPRRYPLKKRNRQKHPINIKTPGSPSLRRPDKREAGGRYVTLPDTSKASPKETKGSWHGKYCWTKMSKNKCRRRPPSTRYKNHSRTLSLSQPRIIPIFSTGIKP